MFPMSTLNTGNTTIVDVVVLVVVVVVVIPVVVVVLVVVVVVVLPVVVVVISSVEVVVLIVVVVVVVVVVALVVVVVISSVVVVVLVVVVVVVPVDGVMIVPSLQRELLVSSLSITLFALSALAQTWYAPAGVVLGINKLVVAEFEALTPNNLTDRVVEITTSSPSP